MGNNNDILFHIIKIVCVICCTLQSKNKLSLRNLSMVLRQLPPEGGAQEQGKCILESVDLARQAVQLDVTDGTSWCKFVTFSWDDELWMLI